MTAPFAGDELLRPADVTAEYKAFTIAALSAWRRRGGGPAFFKANGVVIYRRSAIEAWLAECEQKSAVAS